MDFGKFFENLGNFIPKIIAQIAEKININLNFNFTINLFGTHIQPNFPEKADPKKIAETELTPELIERYEEDIKGYLTLHKDFVTSLPEKEAFQFVADSSAMVMSGEATLPDLRLKSSISRVTDDATAQVLDLSDSRGETASPSIIVTGTRPKWPPDDSGETM